MTKSKSIGRAADGGSNARSPKPRAFLTTGETDPSLPLALTCRVFWAAIAGAAALAGSMDTVRAGTITIPNASFESQLAPNPYAPPYVEFRVDSWQKNPKPASWDDAVSPWDYQVGLFANTPPGDPSRLDNCDGNQAIYLFANPLVGFFQDFDSIDWSTNIPSHAFNPSFEVGKSYRLTVGVTLSYHTPPVNGATLALNLYYRDAASNQVVVATTSITNTPEVFTNVAHLLDFQVNVPTVEAADDWAGKHIGVAVNSSIVDTNLAGGNWDVDNVRLTATRTPVLTGSARTNGQFSFNLESEPGLGFEILASSNLSLPSSNWTSVGTVSNLTGSVPFSEPATNYPGRFYRVRQLP